ncbi:unnamed protein product [marine sediment metagenome]|uniref:Uncharacterized protein n=1 Tax=marine sediment metagenome TaxID=412755 RepID=X1T478_9ZZZZ
MGAWDYQSFENDAVFDELDRAGRRSGKGFSDPGGLTKDRLEKYLVRMLQPVLMSKKEKEIQTALGSMPPLHDPQVFLGIVIWGLDRGFHFQSLILEAALDAGHILVNDEREFRSWRLPEKRRRYVSNEISRLVRERNEDFVPLRP